MVAVGVMPRRVGALFAVVVAALSLTAHGEAIPLRSEGGTFVVQVLVNNKITLDFTLDSGAADVSIPLDVFSTLRRTRTISESDMLPSAKYTLADGSVHQAARFRIQSLRIGSLELRDVVGTVAPAQGTLLLGQSFLSRLKDWAVDNQRHVLLINEGTSTHAQVQVESPQTATSQAPLSGPGEPPLQGVIKATSCISGHASLNMQVSCVDDAFRASCPPGNWPDMCKVLSELDQQANSILNQVRAGKLDESDAQRRLLVIAVSYEGKAQ